MMVPFSGELLKPAPSVHGHEVAEAHDWLHWGHTRPGKFNLPTSLWYDHIRVWM